MLQPNFRKVAFIFDRSISIEFKSGLYGGRYVPRGCNWGAPYFNSRPSARGDGSVQESEGNRNISIPAPPQGATGSPISPQFSMIISIHAPPRGATPMCKSYLLLIYISIPAPPRGATWARWRAATSPTANFNSRPSERGDGPGMSMRSCDSLFQFPPLREGRPRSSILAAAGCYFNSRPSARGDVVGREALVRPVISIPAPPRGATRHLGGRAEGSRDISIPAPPRGATFALSAIQSQMVISIPAPPRGATGWA